MSEVKRWKLKGFLPGVEGECKAVFQPTVVMAEDFDRVTAERDSLQQQLNQRDEQVETLKLQHQGEAVAWRYRESESTQWRLTEMSPSTWYFDPRQYEARNLYERPAPQAVVPDGYCIMPRQLTAENGAKALLLGEFKLLATMECPECCELDEPTEGCSICDGEGEYGQKHTIPWDQIKFIYSKAVSGLAVKAESAKSL